MERSTASETLIGNNDANQIDGGGDDILGCFGGQGFGAVANDSIVAFPGCEVASGGEGRDEVSMHYPEGVTVTLDGVAEAGTPTALMNVQADVENLYGTAFADQLTGSDVHDVFFGFDGRDQLSGRGGNDRLRGERGSDDLAGGAYDDTLIGGSNDDVMDGEDGTDSCKQGKGSGSPVNCEVIS